MTPSTMKSMLYFRSVGLPEAKPSVRDGRGSRPPQTGSCLEAAAAAGAGTTPVEKDDGRALTRFVVVHAEAVTDALASGMLFIAWVLEMRRGMVAPIADAVVGRGSTGRHRPTCRRIRIRTESPTG